MPNNSEFIHLFLEHFNREGIMHMSVCMSGLCVLCSLLRFHTYVHVEFGVKCTPLSLSTFFLRQSLSLNMSVII